jgi:hypothetical protein
MSPFAKIQTLSAIYFPVFATRVEELYSTSKQFEVWITKGAKKRLLGDIASINDGLDAAYKPYLDCLRAFAADVRTYAKQEFE